MHVLENNGEIIRIKPRKLHSDASGRNNGEVSKDVTVQQRG